MRRRAGVLSTTRAEQPPGKPVPPPFATGWLVRYLLFLQYGARTWIEEMAFMLFWSLPIAVSMR